MVKLACLCLALLAPFAVLAGDVPEDLRPPALSAVPDEVNAILLLRKRMTMPSPEDRKLWREALARLSTGRAVENTLPLEQAAAIHAVTAGLEKLPCRLSNDPDSLNWVVPIHTLVQAEELLGRQAILKGDHKEVEAHAACLLAWNHSLREAGPTLLGSIICSRTWTAAFSLLFADWETRPDQEAHLDEIERLFKSSRFTVAESILMEQREYEFSRSVGPIRSYYEKPKMKDLLPILLNPPFNQIEPDELLKLPYDDEATQATFLADARANIADIRSANPMDEWTTHKRNFPSRTLADYKSMPNGFASLLKEQSGIDEFAPRAAPLITAVQVDACLHWLRLERSGNPVSPEDPAFPKDPMDGKPLKFDQPARLIRSVGTGFKSGDPNPAAAIPAGPGFLAVGGNHAFRVPAWRK